MKVTQSYPTLCNPMYYTFHRILQARILEWVTVPLSRESSQPRDWTLVSRIAGGFFANWTIGEPDIATNKCHLCFQDLVYLFNLSTHNLLPQVSMVLYCLGVFTSSICHFSLLSSITLHAQLLYSELSPSSWLNKNPVLPKYTWITAHSVIGLNIFTKAFISVSEVNWK